MARCAIPVLVAVSAGLVGCAQTSPTNRVDVPAGEYTAAFDAAREVLRDFRFRLARVDAAAGVVSTEQKASAGLATPWDLDQSTAGQEFDDLLNAQSRSVRVTFERAGGGPPEESAPSVGDVWVTVYRTQTAGLRVPSKAAGLTTIARDPQQEARGLGPVYEVPVTRDEALERRIAAKIAARVAKQTSGGGGSQEPANAAPASDQ